MRSPASTSKLSITIFAKFESFHEYGEPNYVIRTLLGSGGNLVKDCADCQIFYEKVQVYVRGHLHKANGRLHMETTIHNQISDLLCCKSTMTPNYLSQDTSPRLSNSDI